MKTITLTQGKVALVSDRDYPSLRQHKWCANRTKAGYWYATRGLVLRNGVGKLKIVTLKMHRVIMSAPKGVLVDHRNGDGLNNTRRNLRCCTRAQNNQNRSGASRVSRSGVRGVYFNVARQMWHSFVWKNATMAHSGWHDTKEAAARSAARARRRLFGAFAGA